MNEEPDIEDEAYLARQLRDLRPAPLPDELRDQMRRPPARNPRRFLPTRVWAPLAAAAALSIGLFLWPQGEIQSLSVSRRDSTLLASNSLAVLERDGRLWEVVEQIWRDDESLFCSASPLVVRHLAQRREIVTLPVRFD